MSTLLTKHIPGPHEVETFSGSYVDTKKPDPATIKLEDVAHALANICRYGGHCKTFYSVAEHAVFVSKRLERQGHPLRPQLAGLHHDDSEAFLGDIPRPLKPLLGKSYENLTDKMDMAICTSLFGADDPFVIAVDFHGTWVKAADTWALYVEARHLLPSEGRTWTYQLEESRIVTPDYWLGGLEPAEAEQLFLARHKELTCDL